MALSRLHRSRLGTFGLGLVIVPVESSAISAILAAASGCLLLLAGCGNVVGNVSSDSSMKEAEKTLSQKPSGTHGDFANSQLWDLPDMDKFRGGEAVVELVKKHCRNVDLRVMRWVKKPPSREDFAPFASPEATKYVRMISLADVNLQDERVLEPTQGLHLTDFNLEKNHVRKLDYLKHMTTLTHLNVARSDVDSAGMSVIGGLPELVELILSQTNITDSDLRYLYRLKKLRSVELSGCPRLSKAGVDALRKSLPLTAVNWNPTIK